MLAGTARIDITPSGSVWMDGMIRTRRSEGIHDRLHARALVVANGREAGRAFGLVSVDVCVLDDATTTTVRKGVQARTGIPAAQLIIAATHTHSGPAAVGIFNPREEAWVRDLSSLLVDVTVSAVSSLRPALAAVTTGREDTISHYRRLLADDGHVVMNWEPFPPERIVRPLGAADTEVGVLKVVSAADPRDVICVLFNHAGHPNILSGDNHLLSADYPGRAAALLEEELGGTALFLNGAQGSVDVDGLRHRDWEGLERAARALAGAVSNAARSAPEPRDVEVRGHCSRYVLPGRRITDEEWLWAEEVLRRTGGVVQATPDGIGDDWKAGLYRRLREEGPQDLEVEQICVALGDCALLSFPGELYAEIGREIRSRSPFARTWVVGLANGYTGYIPTRDAIRQGGYAEDTRRVDASAEAIVVEHSLALAATVHAGPTAVRR